MQICSQFPRGGVSSHNLVVRLISDPNESKGVAHLLKLDEDKAHEDPKQYVKGAQHVTAVSTKRAQTSG